MEVKYDKSAKALYVKLMDDAIFDTEEIVSGTVMVDKNRLGQVVGIEVLGVDEVK